MTMVSEKGYTAIDTGMTNQVKIRSIIQGHAIRGDIYNHDEGEEFAIVEITLRALQEYGDDLIPTLVDALSDPDEAVREVGMRLLWEMDTDDESVLPAMLKSATLSSCGLNRPVAGRTIIWPSGCYQSNGKNCSREFSN